MRRKHDPALGKATLAGHLRQTRAQERPGPEYRLCIPRIGTATDHPSLVLYRDCKVIRSKQVRSLHRSRCASRGCLSRLRTLGSGNLLIKNVSRDKSHFATYWGQALVTTACFGSFLLVAGSYCLALCFTSEYPAPVGRIDSSVGHFRAQHHYDLRAGVHGCLIDLTGRPHSMYLSARAA